MRKSLVIGLTGGVGTGKSTVASILKELGLKIIDADRIAHQLLRPGTEVYRQVLTEFGPDILKPDGEIDRRRLGKIVFNDPEKRRLLEGITHPAIKAQIRAEVESYRAKGQDVVLEIPLLFEAKMEGEVDEVWVVAVSSPRQLQRIMERDALTPAEAQSRIKAQMPLSEKCARADVVINNEGTIADLRRQVKTLLKSRRR
ncbi:MAG: dephospho-CoA kinase [Firmicutes bacterium]|nr:dephospho-CoA kinase [Bacillota bacterium]